MSREKKNTLIMQGSILALAGFITKIIGFVYRIPMANMLGDVGNGVYSVAFGIYNIALTLSSYSLPLAVSKLVAYRMAKKDYKNAYRVFVHALMLALVVGSTAAIVLFAGAGVLERWYDTKGLAYPLRVLAPTTFVVALLGVYRGFFQGNSKMLPTAISQIVEQIVNAIVSVVATYQFIKIYSGADNVGAYGAAGGTFGTLAGAFAALFFMVIVFYLFKRRRQQEFHQGTGMAEESREIYKSLIATIIPVILSQTVYQIGYTLDDAIFGKIMTMKGLSKEAASALRGVFNTQYSQLINLPVAIATAMATSTIPTIVQSFLNGGKRDVHRNVDQVIKLNMAIAIPCAVGLTVLGGPIVTILFPRLVIYRVLASRLLLFGSSAVVFYAMSTITTAILQASNRMIRPVIHCAVSLGIHIVIIASLLWFTDLETYALLIGNVTFPLIVCLLNMREVSRTLEYEWKGKEMLLKPFVASIVMGAATWAAYVGVVAFTGKLLVAFIVAMLVAFVVYGKMIMVLSCFTEEEFDEIPMGRKLYGILRRL